jgi:outer membrane protein
MSKAGLTDTHSYSQLGLLKRLYFWVVFSVMLFSRVAVAANSPQQDSGVPQQLTLEEASRIALKNHPLLLSAEFGDQAAAENIDDVRSAYLPQVTGDAVRTFDDRGTVIAASGGLTSSSVIERGSVGLGLSQLITDFGKTSNLIASSRLELESQKEHTNYVRETVLLNVISAYYEVLRSQSLLQVAKDALKTRSTLFKQVSELRKAKMKSDLDVSIGESAVADANLLLLKARSAVDDAQATLSEALGLSQPRLFEPVDHVSIVPPPSFIGPLISTALEQNPEIAQLKAESNALIKTMDAARDAKYPTVSAIGLAGGSPYRVGGQSIAHHYEAAGFLISVPFFTGGRITAEEKEAEYKALAAKQDLIARMNELQRDVRIAFDNVQTAYQNIEVTRRLLKSTHESLELTQARYQLGRSSIVDLNEAQLADTQAAITEANADYEYLIQRAVLDYRVGNIPD